MKRYPNGVDGEFFHQKRVPAAPGLRRRAVRPVPERALDGLRGRRQRRRARLGRQPRLHRAAHLALARGRHRAARLPADRPRPERGEPVGVRPRDRARREGRDGRARAGVATRRPRARPACTSSRRSSPSSRSRRCGASRRRSRRRSSGGSATRTSRRRPGRSPTGAASSSTSARTRATGRSRRAYSIRPTPDARVSAPLRWDEVARCDPARFTLEDDAQAASTKVGDLTAGMWRRKAA